MSQISAEQATRLPIDSPHLSARTQALIQGTGTYIDGKWITGGGEPFAVVDPSFGTTVGHITASSADDVRAAIASSRRAFDDGRWSGLSPAQRSAVLFRLVDILRDNEESLAELGALEVGTPITLSRGLHGSSVTKTFEWWAETALRGPNGGYEQGLGFNDSPTMSSSTLLRDPIGVVASITPYNYPLLITAFKLGGILGAGCTTVLFPSSKTSLSAIAFIRCLEEAGVPAGVVNLVVGDVEVGETLTTSPGIDLISFTGSVGVGRIIGQQAAKTFTPAVLELGGKSPNILLPGVDIDKVVGPSILRYVRNSGQGCGATTRTIVPRADYEEYAEAATAFIAKLRVGSAWDESTDVGPVIRAEHRASIEGYVDRALAQGATVLAGGGRPDAAEGFLLNPSLIGGVTNDAEICQEELFGPVGVLLPYDSVEEAIQIANDTRFGLNANVWGPTKEAVQVARRIKSGTVGVNGGGADLPQYPWGGFGDSGIGVDRSMEGYSHFFRARHLQISLEQPPLR